MSPASVHDCACNRCLRARLAEVEQARDSAFETWKKFHQDTLAAFIKNEHEPLKARLAEAERDRDAGWKAFYALRDQVGKDRYPGLTNVVRAADSASHRENDSHE